VSPITFDHEQLMRYLDGELSADERARVDAELARSTELQRELAIYRAMQRDVQGLSFAPAAPGRSVWGDVNRRLARPLGWMLFSSGITLWAAWGAWLFTTSAVNLWPKLAVGAIVIGLLLLFGSVAYERWREWQTDPYRDVHR
jgi:anti-sigma factor RsiW